MANWGERHWCSAKGVSYLPGSLSRMYIRLNEELPIAAKRKKYELHFINRHCFGLIFE